MSTTGTDKDVFDTAALQSLQAAKHRNLLDIIDNLRAQGLNDHVDLPQLIVCGDQSSGKSSVLAAISGVPFPKKDNLCTRFATEVNLRRNDVLKELQITVSIMPSTSRAPADRNTLEAYRHELKSMTDLPVIVEEASQVMGLGSMNAAFSADVLRLEVRGPYLPQLTIVDLPGLIHSENKHQSEEDIKLVTKLVEHYMLQERSIMLAVVSAKNDYANQIVLAKARKVDPQGRRTLGIITKPDTLYHRSASEASFISLAKNQDIQFSLGWHVVRNLDSNESTAVNRDAQEEAFFRTTEWRVLDGDQCGIHSLRIRLSSVLFQQIRKELPSLISEITIASEDTSDELNRMGPSRATSAEKQMFLVALGQKFQDLCRAACEGQYDDPFFGESDNNRLRAIVQNLNIDFAQRMQQAVPRYAFRNSSTPNAHGKTSILDRAKALIRSHRGKELPGTFNPLLIGELFRELSHPWSKQTQNHAERLWKDARTTIIAILTQITDEHVRDSCMKIVIDPQLEQIRQGLAMRLQEYMQEYRRQAITYNHYLTDTVQAAKNDRHRQETLQKLQGLFSQFGSLIPSNAEHISKVLCDDKEPDMDSVAAESLTDYAEAYYKVAIKRVMDEVPAHVIEPAIMLPLPKLLDPSTILQTPQETMDVICGESEDRMKHRESLQAKLEVLNKSILICKVYAETASHDFTPPSSRESTPGGKKTRGEERNEWELKTDFSHTDEGPADEPTVISVPPAFHQDGAPSEPVEDEVVEMPTVNSDPDPWSQFGPSRRNGKKKKKSVFDTWE